jgi:DNA-binding NarL/FixJ family response regulator
MASKSAHARQPDPAERKARKSSGTVGVTRVMVVDDHPLMRTGLRQMIDAEEDMKVALEAHGAHEALKLLRESPHPQIIVMDLTLEDIGGLELIRQVKDLHGNIPILVLSMHDEGLYAERALRAGARGYIMKREGAQKLVGAIRTVLKGQVWVSEEMSARMLGRFVGGNPATAANPIERLSDRELEVFELVGQGFKSRQIAERLCVSVKTIESHREHIKIKLKLKSATELVQHATQWVLNEGGRSDRAAP